MSLVACRKSNDALILVSDTKLVYDGDVLKRQTGNPLDGTIKSILISRSICISFARIANHANEALEKINASQPLEIMLEILTEYSASDETEFLVCLCQPAKIIKVSAGQCTEEEHTWIGSHRAFSKYQGYYLKDLKPKQVNQLKLERVFPESGEQSFFSEVSNAFDNVIMDPDVPEVDGFKVIVQSMQGAFLYKGYNHSYMANETITIPRNLKRDRVYIAPMFQKSASTGSYSVNFFTSLDNVSCLAVHIFEGNFGIIYTRQGGLHKPTVYKLDEVDFVDFTKDQFGIGPNLTSQDRGLKFLNQGKEFFKSNDFKSAITFFDKALAESNKKVHAAALFNKGLALINMGDKQGGVLQIDKAVARDRGLYSEALKIISSLGKGR